jgi:hypothetical protein
MVLVHPWRPPGDLELHISWRSVNEWWKQFTLSWMECNDCNLLLPMPLFKYRRLKKSICFCVYSPWCRMSLCCFCYVDEKTGFSCWLKVKDWSEVCFGFFVSCCVWECVKQGICLYLLVRRNKTSICLYNVKVGLFFVARQSSESLACYSFTK